MRGLGKRGTKGSKGRVHGREGVEWLERVGDGCRSESEVLGGVRWREGVTEL